jgi:glycosyltransferase involved in cell wall biosynthesis
MICVKTIYTGKDLMNNKLKILEIAPLCESVPPKLYGGTERVVSYLTEALVDNGADVTLMASGDSKTKAKLIPMSEEALRLGDKPIDPLVEHYIMIQKAYEMAEDFDIIHNHLGFIAFGHARMSKTPTVSTMHGPMGVTQLHSVHNYFNDHAHISISDAQRRPLQDINWAKTIYHGLPKNIYDFTEIPSTSEDYIAFVGRFSPEKAVHDGIEAAIKAGIKIKIAAKLEKNVDEGYYHDYIKPYENHPLVEMVGEIGESDKSEFIGNAKALILPINWEEPFGLVMIEAMACGTPVIAMARGSVPEVVDHGESGYICHSKQDMVDAINNINQISRFKTRKIFDTRFTADIMCKNHLDLFEQMTNFNVKKENLRSSNIKIG